MCVDVSHVLKGQKLIHGVSFLMTCLLYCTSQAPPAFLSWVCISIYLLTVFLFTIRNGIYHYLPFFFISSNN